MITEKNGIQDEAMTVAIALEEKRKQAMLQGSVALLEPILSESLYYGHSSGYGDNKKVFLQQVENKVYHYLDIEFNIDNAVPIGDDGLVITGEVMLIVTENAAEKTMHSIYLAVWKKERGLWRFLAHQTTTQKS